MNEINLNSQLQNQIDSSNVNTSNNRVVIIVLVMFALASLLLNAYFFFTNKKLNNRLHEIESNTVEQNPKDENITIQNEPTQIPEESDVSNEDEEYVISNSEMMNFTKKLSPNGKYNLWLDGENFSGQKLVVNEIGKNKSVVILESQYDSDDAKVGDYSLASPVWSFDDNKIAYLRFVIRSFGQFDVDMRIDLHTINADGTDDKLIKEDIKIVTGQYSSTDLEWSKQGITYTDMSSSVDGEKITIPIN